MALTHLWNKSCLEFLIPFFTVTRLKCSLCAKGLGQLGSTEITDRVCAVGMREHEGLDLTWQRKQNKTKWTQHETWSCTMTKCSHNQSLTALGFANAEQDNKATEHKHKRSKYAPKTWSPTMMLKCFHNRKTAVKESHPFSPNWLWLRRAPITLRLLWT